MLENLYTILEENHSDGIHQYKIELNKNHHIFDGHFPQQPVLPGVCQIGIVNQLLQEISDLHLEFVRSKNIKFLKMIDPVQCPILEIEMKILDQSEESLTVNTVMSGDGDVSLKFRGIFKTI